MDDGRFRAEFKASPMKRAKLWGAKRDEEITLALDALSKVS
jgi:hypothetical protein